MQLKKGSGKNTTKLLTRLNGLPTFIYQGSQDYDKALDGRPQVFELMHNLCLFEAHNEIRFYTWGEQECCLPKGATSATLRDDPDPSDPTKRLRLCVGDVLILQEQLGPNTGTEADADPTRRQAVRLTSVRPEAQRVFQKTNEKEEVDRIPASPILDPLTNTPIVEIEWSREDELAYPFCISARSGAAYYDNVSVALGNIVLADHGITYTDEPENRPFDPVKDPTSLDPDVVPNPNPKLTKVAPSATDRCEEHPVLLTPPRYRPKLKQAPLTHAAPYDWMNPPVSAKATMCVSTGDRLQIPLPVIALSESHEPIEKEEWQPKHDLLNSGPNKKEFVVEIETDGTAYLRFGDDQLGSRPSSGTRFMATYRIGNGTQGNVGSDALGHLVSSAPDITDRVIAAVCNPLPAQGGTDPETIEHVRQDAVSAFRKQERAVTPEDYAEVAQRCSLGLQRAAATFRWTGSWRTCFVTVDRLGGEKVDEIFERKMRRCLERYRMAGHDIEVDGPRYVSLEVEMIVCVKRAYFTSDVKTSMLEVFSNRILPGGRHGVFHPDNFTFGQTVYLSSLYAAAQAVAGVDSVSITKFQRQGILSDQALKTGKLELAHLEIARLDNDLNFPERGVLVLIMKGGR